MTNAWYQKGHDEFMEYRTSDRYVPKPGCAHLAENLDAKFRHGITNKMHLETCDFTRGWLDARRQNP